MVISLRLLLLLGLTATATNALWFNAYDKSRGAPFCFIDHMTQETDYIIKWSIDEVSQVSVNETTKPPAEKGKPVLYFNITKFRDVDGQEANNATRKYIEHYFHDTAAAENHTKGSFHFSVEHGRLAHD